MNRQALLAAALAVMTIGVPPLARADLAADQKTLDDANTTLAADQKNNAAADKIASDQKAVKDAQAQVNADNNASNNYGCFNVNVALKKHKAVQNTDSSASADTVCIVGGAFAIPFRAELTGKKDVLGGVSGDLFAGLNITLPNGFFHSGVLSGFSITPLIYFGYLPTLNATNANNSTNTSSTGGALDVGVGIAIPLRNIDQTDPKSSNVHVGIVFGTNVTGAANKFAYNGKIYTSAFIGLSF